MDGRYCRGRKKEILEVAINKALEGKPSMIELLLGRMLPPVSLDDAVDVNLKDKTHKERSEEILAAVTEKRISPGQAHILFAALCDSVKLAEMTEVIDRIKALEEAQLK